MLLRMTPANEEARSNSQRGWLVVALLFVVAVLNYFDRQSLSVVAPRIQAELHLSDLVYGHIVSLFLFASAIAYALSGFICDALGTRTSMALFVGIWSAAEAATAFAHTAITLALARFCLGLGEPGLWVAAPKVVGETMERPRRALAIGIYTAGATLGAVIAIPIILAVTTHLPWRSIFLLDGACGLLWVPLWLALYRSRGPNSSARQTTQKTGSLLDVLRHRQTWLFMIARGLTDPVWYFYLFWFPKYLINGRHLSTAALSHFAWLVYLAAGIGTIGGGYLSGRLIRLMGTATLAYRRVMLFCALLVLVSPLTYLSKQIGPAMIFACIVALAHMAWLTNLTSALLEIFPAEQLGKAAGFIAAGSALGGMVSSELIAYFVTHGGYGPVFYLMGFMHSIAIILLWKAFRPTEHIAATA